MNKNLLIAVGIFLVMVVVGLFLIKKPTNSGAKLTEITVTGNEYSYNPASITVKRGERIKLTFINAGTIVHNLVIDELNVKTKMIEPGKSNTIEFTVEGNSTLVFYCSIGNHKALGMKGELKIEQ